MLPGGAKLPSKASLLVAHEAQEWVSQLSQAPQAPPPGLSAPCLPILATEMAVLKGH